MGLIVSSKSVWTQTLYLGYKQRLVKEKKLTFLFKGDASQRNIYIKRKLVV